MLLRVVHDEVTSAELLLRIPIGGVLLCVRQARSQQTMLGVSRMSGSRSSHHHHGANLRPLFSPSPFFSSLSYTPFSYTLPSVRVVRKDQGVESPEATRGFGVRRVCILLHTAWGLGRGYVFCSENL